jgi:hypothetical protein
MRLLFPNKSNLCLQKELGCSLAVICTRTNNKLEMTMARAGILWLLGVPVTVIILLALFTDFI